ncbi:MAG: UDP-N-acetylmuramate dehydrogenase [Methylophilaceae bacterium]|nr:UDP-N-acetylmuramate dehydrogenase [Methylophilaceae bacterium]
MHQMQPTLSGQLLLNEPLARYNSWRVGGSAERFYIASSLSDLSHFLQSLHADEPVCFIGLGSNLLVRDGGVRGTVILMHSVLNTLKTESDAIYADAGVTCAKVAKFSAKHAKQGGEFMAGIPGTVGGALAMNAGCYGSETWDVIAKVQTISRRGEIQIREKSAFKTSYRRVEMATGLLGIDEWFVGAWFELKAGNADESAQKIKELLAKRLASQPLNLPNAGSTFRNPAGDYAARLIEASGLKGFQVGGAQVSTKHTNFIVNLGGSTAADIEQLIAHMRDTVKQQFGVELRQEVRVIGEKLGGEQISG